MAAPSILGLHHVTATVDGAQHDSDFSVAALGLRLVKKTVNFDNHHVYHFYYGNERGTPGTIWTTFPYRGHGVPVGRKGAGQITVTSFSVPAGSLPFWRSHLRARNLAVEEGEARFGEESLVCLDPSGLVIELVAGADTREPWADSPVGHEAAIRGLHSVTMTIPQPGPTVQFMTRVLGFEVVGTTDGRIRLAVNGDGPGKRMEIVPGSDVPHALNGLGTVHHVAMAVAESEEQLRIRAQLVQLGWQVTPVRDRQDFQSIYFREPGGVLFEIATMKPGFDVDEPLADLGRSLKLPPWEEPYRAEIEAGLASVWTSLRAEVRSKTLMQPHAGQPVEVAGSPLESASGVVVMVHGRNAGPPNILDLVPRLNRPQFAFAAPAAADRTWYPYSFLSEIPKNEPGISSGMFVLDHLVSTLVAEGVTRERIILLGFSQGACLASEFAVRHAQRYGGLIAFSGGLIGPPGTTWDYEGRFDDMPVYFGCSDADAHIPKERVEESARVLKRMGADVTMQLFPGMGHLVSDAEIEQARVIMDRVGGN